MKYFPDEPVRGAWATYAIAALPLAYLFAALLYSANSAPWGQQVDPESAYAMTGLAWAAHYPMMKSDHPGTTTTLLVGLIIKAWTSLAGRSDVIEFGLKNYDAIIYASRAAEALILSGALLASGIVVRNATRSAVAAMLFQVAPLVTYESFRFVMILVPESLMVSCAILGMALVLKATLDESPPATGLGVAQGVIFALGLSSKILYAPLAILGVSLLRNWRAFAMASLVGAFGFWIFNLVLNPDVFSGGRRWLVSLATHNGIYGGGEAGFIDFDVFWPNMGELIAAAPVVSAVFAVGAVMALARMITSRRYLDPVSLTLLASVLAFVVQLVATSKHFAIHYMLASWALTGGVLVLIVIETRRLVPAVSPLVAAGAPAMACLFLIATTLVKSRSNAVDWIALDATGAGLSKAVIAAAPSCANVSAMLVRAPENISTFGGVTTLATNQMRQRFGEAYARAFNVPLLDHDFYENRLLKNFQPYSYAQLASDYPCIVVRTHLELDARTSNGLLELKPDHCMVQDIHVYAVGIPCATIRRAAQSG